MFTYFLFVFCFYERRTRLESEEIVAELVTSFLLPEVERINMRENGKLIKASFANSMSHSRHNVSLA